MADGEVAPDGQHHRQPDGDGVEHLRDVHVGEHEDGPAVGEGGAAERLQVVVQREGHVHHHHHDVGDRQAGQDGVRRRHHRLAGEYHDAEDVGRQAEDADGQSQVAVDFSVAVEEGVHAGTAVLRRQDRHVLRQARHVVRHVLLQRLSCHLKQTRRTSG